MTAQDRDTLVALGWAFGSALLTIGGVAVLGWLVANA